MAPSSRQGVALKRAILTALPTLIPSPGEGTYEFHRYPFGERGDYIDAELLQEVLDGLAGIARDRFPAVDVVLCPEPGGHTWGMALARELGCSLAIMREGSSDEGDHAVDRRSAYRHSTLVPPRLAGHPRVIVVDDVISSGGTLITMLTEIAKLDCELAGGIVILAKGTLGIERVRQASAIPVIPLATLSEDRRVHLTMMAENPV